MKKFFSLLLVMLFELSAFASSDDVVVRSGDAKSIAIKGITINVVFDYTGSQIYDMKEKQYYAVSDYIKMKGEEWERDFPSELKKAEDAFIEEFNEDSKKAVFAVNSDNAKFTLTFKLKDFSYGKAVVWSSKDRAWGSGVLEVVNNETRDTVVVFEFTKVDGKTAAGIGQMELRREECYEHVAEALAKLLNKKK